MRNSAGQREPHQISRYFLVWKASTDKGWLSAFFHQKFCLDVFGQLIKKRYVARTVTKPLLVVLGAFRISLTLLLQN